MIAIELIWMLCLSQKKPIYGMNRKTKVLCTPADMMVTLRFYLELQNIYLQMKTLTEMSFHFQANEENGLGAKAMINDGLFDQFKIEQIYALHNLPGMPVGHFATRKNTITASESSFQIDIHSKGGHSALPNMGSDAIFIASQIVTALQSIVSRKVDPRKNAVVSVTEFLTNGSKNVLASHATLKGDTRSIDDEVRLLIEEELNNITKGICLSNKASYDFTFKTKFPITKNAIEPTQNIIFAYQK